MSMDSNNPVVRLCQDGMRAEFADDPAGARALFEQAWAAARDDYEACVAAHFLARHQPGPAETLRWNQLALERAARADPELVRGFYPSLYLNLGYAWERMGDRVMARQYYQLAESGAGALPAGSYGALVRGGVASALERTAEREEQQ
jgi:hypothetical protein